MFVDCEVGLPATPMLPSLQMEHLLQVVPASRCLFANCLRCSACKCEVDPSHPTYWLRRRAGRCSKPMFSCDVCCWLRVLSPPHQFSFFAIVQMRPRCFSASWCIGDTRTHSSQMRSLQHSVRESFKLCDKLDFTCCSSMVPALDLLLACALR